MKIYHTSPNEISEINDEGRFGSGLFFSDNPYFMTNESSHVYGLEIPNEEILEHHRLEYLDEEDYKKIKPFIDEIKKKLGVSESKALSLLSQTTDLNSEIWKAQDVLENNQFLNNEERDELMSFLKKVGNDSGEHSWDIQSLAGKAANALGYSGITSPDETGISYLINMSGREKELKKQKQHGFYWHDEDEEV